MVLQMSGGRHGLADSVDTHTSAMVSKHKQTFCFLQYDPPIHAWPEMYPNELRSACQKHICTFMLIAVYLNTVRYDISLCLPTDDQYP